MRAEGEEWPRRRSLFGIAVSATAYDGAVDAILAAARARRSSCVSALAVHGLMTGVDDPEFGRVLNRFDMLVPDGQPVRLALNLLHEAALSERVYGPELMLRVCARAAEEGVGIYLYGSDQDTVQKLAMNLTARFPALPLVGHEPSLFRPLTPREDTALIERIRSSGAGVVFVGLGCPRQERFADEHRRGLAVVQVCVGAAFDFHAGTKPMAPPWMQRWSLEWLFRLAHEPRRLFRRYATTNTRFAGRLLAAWWRSRIASTSAAYDGGSGASL